MKTTLFALFLLAIPAAFAQANYTATYAASSQAQMLEVVDHPQHAEQHALATEHPLLSSSDSTYARGERPLGDFVPVPPRQSSVPLGDVARVFRKEKLATKKAEIVFEKQGS